MGATNGLNITQAVSSASNRKYNMNCLELLAVKHTIGRLTIRYNIFYYML